MSLEQRPSFPKAFRADLIFSWIQPGNSGPFNDLCLCLLLDTPHSLICYNLLQ